ncbi:hypothetical protein [Streptomyces sp. NPDC001927]
MAKKRNPKHAKGNSAWLDAAKRAARVTVPVFSSAAGSTTSSPVQEAVKAVLEWFIQ